MRSTTAPGGDPGPRELDRPLDPRTVQGTKDKQRGNRAMDTIEGTWRLVRAIARDDAGNPRPSPYDGEGMGRIVIGGGRMAVMMIDWRHDVPGGQKREYSGYTGTYTYDGKQLVTTVDAAPDPQRIGTKQAR